MSSYGLAPNKKIVLLFGYLFVFLTLIDFPLVIIYTFTKSHFMVNFVVYSSEAIIMAIFVYLLFNSSFMKIPAFMYVFVIYITLAAMAGIMMHYNAYQVIKHARRFIAFLPPILLGFHFSFFFGGEREQFINKIIKFLTILSIISLVEWIMFYRSYHSMIQFYSRYFNVGAYYAEIKKTSYIHKSGLLGSAMTQRFQFIPGYVQFKRATGVYLEGYAAGFNPATAVFLIVYSKIAGHKVTKKTYAFMLINLAAVFLATSRSAYIFVFMSLIGYIIIQRKLNLAFLLSIVPFFYGPFRAFLIGSVDNLGGSAHRHAIVSLPNFLLDSIISIEALIGTGLGSVESFADMGAIKDIFTQLGIFGLFSVFYLYFVVMKNIYTDRAGKFFVLTLGIALFIFAIYAGRMFGYKSFGWIHFLIGFMTPIPQLQASKVQVPIAAMQIQERNPMIYGNRIRRRGSLEGDLNAESDPGHSQL